MSTTLSQMSQLAQTLLDADVGIKDLEQKLKKAKERARDLREETIPAAMQELNLSTLGLLTGQVITIKRDVYASIPKDQQAAAYKWLEDNGFGDIIKSVVNVEFGRKELAEAQKLTESLTNNGMNAALKESIHGSTLKAFLREQIAAGTKVPLDKFGARPVWVATIK